jgi:hypothetical protein
MEMVPINKIAEELGVNKDYALRLVKRRSTALGLRPQRGRRNAVSLSRDDADRLIRDYRPRVPASASGNEIARHSDFGYFYIIQLHPEDLPGRLKIGYTDNLGVRLSDHRTSAPTLKLIRSWPCKRTWEEAAKVSITRGDCRCVGGEVFDGDVEAFVERAEAFFSIMPGPPGSSLETGRTDSTDIGEQGGAADRR